MEKQFTASEVRDWERAYKGTGAAKVFGAFADLLEAQEKAVPVMVVNHVSSAEHDLPIGMKLYTHPSPAGAERLAEALRNARGFVLHFGDEPARVCIAEIDAALAAHSAQAQPKNVSFVRETWTEDADGDRPNLCTICGKPLRYGTRHTACAIAQSQPPAARA